MTKGHVSVTTDMQATETIQLLQKNHLIRVPIVDAQEKLVASSLVEISSWAILERVSQYGHSD